MVYTKEKPTEVTHVISCRMLLLGKQDDIVWFFICSIIVCSSISHQCGPGRQTDHCPASQGHGEVQWVWLDTRTLHYSLQIKEGQPTQREVCRWFLKSLSHLIPLWTLYENNKKALSNASVTPLRIWLVYYCILMASRFNIYSFFLISRNESLISRNDFLL